jgi:hypothetical protein
MKNNNTPIKIARIIANPSAVNIIAAFLKLIGILFNPFFQNIQSINRWLRQ